MSLALSQNKNLSVLAYVEVFWWARVDVASRASKKAPQGLFYPPDCSAGRCCSNPPTFVSLTHKQNKKLQRAKYARAFLVGAGGFEPPKLKAADLQSVPIGHSGTRPYSLFVSFAGRLVYSIMQKGFCQLFFYLFLQMRFPCRETAEQRREKPRSHAGTAKSEKKASRKKLIGKLQEKLGTICEKCKTFCLCIEKRRKA